MTGLIPVQTLSSELSRKKEYLEWLLDEVKNSEKWTDELTDYANRNMRTKNYEEAISIYQRILQFYPLKVNLHTPLGDCFFNLKNYDSAISNYQKALQSNPENELVLRVKVAQCYLSQNKLKECLAECETSLDILDKSNIPDKERLRNLFETMIIDIKTQLAEMNSNNQ